MTDRQHLCLVIGRICWAGAALSAVVNLLTLFFAEPESAPQQAALAAMVVAWVVLPYVLARAWTETTAPLPARDASPVMAFSVPRLRVPRALRWVVAISAAVVAVLVVAGFAVDWWYHPEAYWFGH